MNCENFTIIAKDLKNEALEPIEADDGRVGLTEGLDEELKEEQLEMVEPEDPEETKDEPCR